MKLEVEMGSNLALYTNKDDIKYPESTNLM